MLSKGVFRKTNQKVVLIVAIIISLIAIYSVNDYTYVYGVSVPSAKSIPAGHTGKTATDIVSIAKSQNGYIATSGGSVYKDYFAVPGGAWCAAFVSWCAYKSGFRGNDFCTECKTSSGKYYSITASPSCFKGKKVSSPQKGDLVFFLWPADAAAGYNYSHIEIVDYVKSGELHTIGGNTGYTKGYSNGAVLCNTYDINDSTIKYYKRPNYSDACKHTSINTTTGKCNNCGEAYINIDKSKLSTSANTSYSAKRFYKITTSAPVYKYPSTGANKYETFPAGRHVQVLGTLSSGAWYKVKYNSTTGYVQSSKITKYSPSSASSTITINKAKDEYSLKHKVKYDFSPTVNSNYPIRKITVTIGSKTYTKTYDSLYLSNITIQKATGFDTSVFAVGTHNYTFSAMDISGKTVKKSGKIVIYDDGVSVPTVKESLVANGKNVLIETKASNATLYYSKNGGSNIKTTNKKVTVSLSEGTTKIKAFVYVGSKRSANITKSFTLSKEPNPDISVAQSGRTGKVTITAANKPAISYSVDGGKTYKTYTAPFNVEGNTTIKAYATAKGFLKSNVVEYTTEFTEPKAPVVKLINDDNNIAEGKTATFNWGADRNAEEYTATLYRSGNDEQIESITTDKNTASFTLPAAGEYYVTVTARNALGDSEASEAVNVTARSPVKLVFRDFSDETDEEGEPVKGEILASIEVPYGDVPEMMAEPSRVGHNFVGWKNSETDKTSINEYCTVKAKKDTEYVAQYSRKTYTVNIFDTTGELLDTQKILYGDSVNTDNLNATVDEDCEILSWDVRNSAKDSKADINFVDSDMDVYAVATWANKDLPVFVGIESSKLGSNNIVTTNIHLKNDDSKDLSFYLIAALKAKDSSTGVEQTVAADRKIVYLDAAGGENNDSEKTISMRISNGGIPVSKVEVIAVQCNDDFSTGTAYSLAAESNITKETGVKNYTEYEWVQNISDIPDDPNCVYEPVTTYRYHDKVIGYSGYDTLSGYPNKSGVEYYNSSTGKWQTSACSTYGGWRSSAPSASTSTTSANKTVITSEKSAAQTYKYYAYVCGCKKSYSSNKDYTCKVCGGKTTKKLTAYFNNGLSYAGYEKTANGCYSISKTIKIGNAYSVTNSTKALCVYFDGQNVDSFASSGNSTFLWYDTKADLYRTKTTKTRNVFWKWGDWSHDANSHWNETPYTANSSRQIESKTEYKYRYEIPEEEAVGGVDIDPLKVRRFSGSLNVETDLSGKAATIMVYQTNNTDPNKYQLQYLGQTEIKEGNSYDFSLVPKEEPSVLTGNYLVALSIEGTTGMIKINDDNYHGIIEAPKAKHTVQLCYEDDEKINHPIGEPQIIEEGGSVDLSEVEIPEREGYYFAGWASRTTDITGKDGDTIEIKAIYLPLMNTVVFVDWINQSLEMQNALTGDKVNAPGEIEEAAGHNFIGWKLPNGDIVEAGGEITVSGNMVVEAAYETDSYTVRFLDVDGNVIDTQEVEYGETAEPPEYTGDTRGGVFVSWSTERNWWDVNGDVDVRPVIDYVESAETPKSRIVETESFENEEIIRGVEFETEEEGAKIYYTTNGEVPTEEMIQEHLNGDPESVNVQINEYSDVLSFNEDTDIIAVSYVEGKNLSEPEYVVFEPQPDPEYDYDMSDVSEDWVEISTEEIKASSGKDVEVSVSLDENPGLLGYNVLVCADNEVFYPDEDEYGDPVVSAGEVADSGRVLAGNDSDGWQAIWYGETQSTKTGELLNMILHVKEDTEDGMYPVSVYYAPEKTYNEEYDDVSLANAIVKVRSQANIDITELEANLSRTSYTYDGSACEPVVTIEGLKEGENFTVSYENNTNAGTAKAVITGKDTYIGTLEKEFTINAVNLVQAEGNEIETQVYKGEPVKPEVNIRYNGMTLKEGTDYELSYSGNTEPGTGTVKVTGKGNYKGTMQLAFEITDSYEVTIGKVQQALAEAQETIETLRKENQSIKTRIEEAESAVQEAETAKKLAEQALAQAKEAQKNAEGEAEAAKAAQKVAEAEMTAAKAAQAEAEAREVTAAAAKELAEQELAQAREAQRNAEGEAEAAKAAQQIAETQAALANAEKNAAEAREETAVAAKSLAELNLQKAETKLAQTQTDLEAAQLAQKNAEADAALSKEAKEEIEKQLQEAVRARECAVQSLETANQAVTEAEKALEEAKEAKEAAEVRAAEAEKALEESDSGIAIDNVISVTGINNKTYTGSAITQTPSVSINGNALTEGTEYSIGYTNNKDVGLAEIHITGKGKYKGTIWKTFRINPKGTSITKLVSGKKCMGIIWKKQTQRMSASRITGYQIRYSLKSSMASSKTVTVKGYTSYTKKITKLKAKKKYYVQVRTYQSVKNVIYYSSWSGKKAVTTK